MTAIRQVAAGETLFPAAEGLALMRQAAQYQAQTAADRRALEQLTRREREVLRALAAGLDNKAIGARLHLSTATVRSHVDRILHKLGVTSRLQAAILALRCGFIDPDDPA